MKIDIGEIKPEREKILHNLHCEKGTPAYERINKELDNIFVEIVPKVSVYIKHEGKYIYVLMSAGNIISDYSKSLMDRGECLGGLAADAVGDETLFNADNKTTDYLKEYLAKKHLGAAKRLQAPNDFPLKEHRKIIEKTGAEDIGLTDAYMFDPPKTMAYILELTEDENVFKAQHDCSKCPNLNCPMRSTTAESIDTVTEHGEIAYNTARDVLCVDIGTTTIAFERICGGERTVFTEVNTQRRFGADVISRIDASNAGRGRELKQLICYQLIKGLKKLYPDEKKPDKIVIAANTTMIHLLMGYPCGGLGKYPFKPYNAERIETDFESLTGSGICSAPVVIIGAISAFVGGDIVSGLYMCDFDISSRLKLFIDLGTNGEMALGSSKGILATSAAAGPAFEGGRISCGTASVEGAVCRVDFALNRVDTIGDKEPVGLCGTGITEITAELLKYGIIDETGLLKDKYFDKGYPVTEKVYFTQKDIREVQNAKAAVCAGIELLVKRYGCSYEDITSVYIAGGFGYKLNTSKACVIGLIPRELENKCIAIGNSSLGGAVKYAFGYDAAQRTEKIRKISKELVLASDDEFNKRYMSNMYFKQ